MPPKVIRENPNPSGLCLCGCGQATTIADYSNIGRQYVAGCPKRYIKGHDRHTGGPEYVVEDRGYKTPCWIWNRNTIYGYGLMKVKGRSARAHRVFYERKYGPIPDGLQPDHLCRQRACVNPDHLEPVTPAENQHRRIDLKLTQKAADEMRQRRANGALLREIADEFGVSQSMVHRVIHNLAWIVATVN